MITFAKRTMMETTRIQTVLRLPPELMERVKRSARKEKSSFNSYVERVLEQATASASAFPTLPRGFKISDEVRSMGKFKLGTPTAEALEADPKLAYLWEKYGNV